LRSAFRELEHHIKRIAFLHPNCFFLKVLRQTEKKRRERERERESGKFTSAAMGGDRDREQQRHIETIKRKKHLLHIVFCARVKVLKPMMDDGEFSFFFVF